jgi:hypothetical protein
MNLKPSQLDILTTNFDTTYPDPDRLFRRFRPSHPDLGLTCITHTYLLADHACHPMSSHNDTTNNENTKRISAFSTMD